MFLGGVPSRENLHLAMDGDRDRDPHWNTGLNSLGPNKKQKEREREQRRQDQREPSSNDTDGDAHWSTGLNPARSK